jgi:hypothetical protein
MPIPSRASWFPSGTGPSPSRVRLSWATPQPGLSSPTPSVSSARTKRSFASKAADISGEESAAVFYLTGHRAKVRCPFLCSAPLFNSLHSIKFFLSLFSRLFKRKQPAYLFLSLLKTVRIPHTPSRFFAGLSPSRCSDSPSGKRTLLQPRDD